MRTKHERAFQRLPLTMVDGYLNFEGLLVHYSDGGGRLCGETARQLIVKFPDLEPHSWREGNGVAYSYWSVRHLRIHRCRRCGAYYLAHWRCGVCSDQCGRALRRPSDTASRQLRRKRSSEYRIDNEVAQECEHCEGRLDARRVSRRFCSDKCRKAAKRRASRVSVAAETEQKRLLVKPEWLALNAKR